MPGTGHCLHPDLSPAGSTSSHSPSWCQAMNAEGEGSPMLTIFYRRPAPSSLDPMSRPRRGGGGRNAISLEKEFYFPASTASERNPGCRWGLSAGPFYRVQVSRRPCSSSGGDGAIFCQSPLQLAIWSCATQPPQVFTHTMFSIQSLVVNIMHYSPVWTPADLASPCLFDMLVWRSWAGPPWVNGGV